MSEPQLVQEKEPVQDLETVKQDTNLQKIKTTLFEDPATHKKHVIIGSWSPKPIADHILKWLDSNGYCQILNIGQSGTGKTVWSKYLIHQLHSKRSFTIHHFSRDDILRLDSIIDKLEKGINHILVLDDASFVIDQLKNEELSKLAQRLTYIRHEVKAQVVIIINIHYSKAIKKFFRNVPFTFMTSISAEEIGSFKDLMGSYAGWKFRNFASYFRQLMIKGQCTIPIDKWNNKAITIKTNNPFRLGVAYEVNHIHYFLWVKESCSICDPDFESKHIVNAREFIDTMTAKYTLKNVRSIIRLYSFARHGLKVIDSKRLAAWHTISEIDKNNKINWHEVNKVLDDTMTQKRSRTYIKKDKQKQALESIESNLAKDIEQEQSLDFSNQMNDLFKEIES